jgi:hypothetical protein
MRSMLWLVALLVAVVLSAWAAWTRGLATLAILLVVPLFVLVFLLGRRIESQRDAGWVAAAQAVQGSFRAGGDAARCAGFGRPAPWDAWAQHGELQCGRAIDGSAARAPFALLQVRYSVREARGEEHPDTWYEVSVAVLPLSPAAPLGRLQAVAAADGYLGAHNGEWLFVWKKGSRGAGQALAARELPALLEEARRTALLRR